MSTSFVDESGTTRIRGTLDPAPAGGIPQGGPLDQDLDAAGFSVQNVDVINGTGGNWTTGGGALATGGGNVDAGGGRVRNVNAPGAADDATPRDWANARVGGQAIPAQGGLVPTSDNFGGLGWYGVLVAAGVPAGVPAGSLPFAFDTTAVTGGFYFWDGAAWVKVATIL